MPIWQRVELTPTTLGIHVTCINFSLLERSSAKEATAATAVNSTEYQSL